MLIALRIIQFFCLFGGGAAMMGNGVQMRKVMAASGPQDPAVTGTMKRLGMIGLASIALLWVEGIAILLSGGVTPDWPFFIKLLAAVAVLTAVIMLSATAAKAERSNRTPDFSRMKILPLISNLGATLAVAFAVVEFAQAINASTARAGSNTRKWQAKLQ